MVAEELGIRSVLVPPRPGAFSAFGLLCSDVVHDYIRSEIVDVEAMGADYAETCFRALEERAEGELSGEGLGESERLFVRELDLRYAGQGYEIRTPLDGLDWRPVAEAGIAQVQERFHALHLRLHGHSAPDSTIEAVSFRLRVRVPVPKPDLTDDSAVTEQAAGAGSVRSVTFDGRRQLEAQVLGPRGYRRKTGIGPADRGAGRCHHRRPARLVGVSRPVRRHRPGSGMSVDPITVELLRNRLASVMQQMDYHFFRSGYSTIVRESRDFSCIIVDAEGRLVVAPWDVFPRAGLFPPGAADPRPLRGGELARRRRVRHQPPL